MTCSSVAVRTTFSANLADTLCLQTTGVTEFTLTLTLVGAGAGHPPKRASRWHVSVHLRHAPICSHAGCPLERRWHAMLVVRFVRLSWVGFGSVRFGSVRFGALGCLFVRPALPGRATTLTAESAYTSRVFCLALIECARCVVAWLCCFFRVKLRSCQTARLPNSRQLAAAHQSSCVLNCAL